MKGSITCDVSLCSLIERHLRRSSEGPVLYSPLTIHLYENTKIHITQRVSPDISGPRDTPGDPYYAGDPVIDPSLGGRL